MSEEVKIERVHSTKMRDLKYDKYDVPAGYKIIIWVDEGFYRAKITQTESGFAKVVYASPKIKLLMNLLRNLNTEIRAINFTDNLYPKIKDIKLTSAEQKLLELKKAEFDKQRFSFNQLGEQPPKINIADSLAKRLANLPTTSLSKVEPMQGLTKPSAVEIKKKEMVMNMTTDNQPMQTVKVTTQRKKTTPRKPFTPYGLNGYFVDKNSNVRLLLDRKANAKTITLCPDMFSSLAEMVRKTQQQGGRNDNTND